MTDPTRQPDRESTTGAPRWVKVVGIIALVVVLALVVMFFINGSGTGGHGPGRHSQAGNNVGVIPSSTVLAAAGTQSGGDLAGHASPGGRQG
ncbi:MAG: hypothetical protein ACR2JK_13920 [Geodermatophilaceae bacterium]